MLAKQYQDYIRRRCLELAVAKYPNDPHKQMLYQIGFLQAQLANAMSTDSHIANKFFDRVKSILDE